jgi:glutamate dehydrogenase
MPAKQSEPGQGTRALAELLEAAGSEARERGRLQGPELDAFASYLHQYYRFVAPHDLLDRNPLDVYGAAASHLQLADQRTPGTALVRVLSPSTDGVGW